jgi:hypothetical protein
MNFFVNILYYIYDFLILHIEHLLKNKKYLILDDVFIKFTNTKNFCDRWIKFYNKIPWAIKILKIQDNVIFLENYKNYRRIFFYYDSYKLIEPLLMMKKLEFFHSDFDFGNIIIAEGDLIILDPNKWVFYKNNFLIDKMIESCFEKNIIKYSYYKKKLQK